MSWISGSSSVGYIDLLDKLVKAATGQGATAAVVVAGGTGYTVGDIITVTGGTFDFPCKLRVTNVSGGVIQAGGVVISEGGSYTSTPSNPVAVTGPGNDDATFNLTFASNGWTLRRRSQQAASATIGAGGSGGTNGTQTVTLGTVGAVGVTTSAQFSVTVAGNTITAVLGVVTPGLYEKMPTNPVAVTGAGLVGATLNVTSAAPTTQDQVAILEGTGGGSDAILVGIRTYQAVNGASTAFNWALYGFSAFNDGLTFNAQAGISPGDPTVATNVQGAFVPLHNSGASFPIDFWFSITPNRIVTVNKVRNGTVTHYASSYQGFLSRFGSPSEWPYPLFIAGSTTRVRALFNSTIPTYVSSIMELIGVNTGGSNGPGWYWRSDSTWQSVNNSGVASDETSPSRTASGARTLFPVGEATAGSHDIDADDNITGEGGFNLSDAGGADGIIANSGVPGTPNLTLHPTPNTGDALRRPYPLTLQLSEPGPPVELDVVGELDGVFWISAADATTPLTSEDFITIGATRYRVFKSGNRALDYTYFAVEEK
jgi:hypothetical protein